MAAGIRGNINSMDIIWPALKTGIIFIYGYFLILTMGKHHIGNTTPLDFLIAVILGNILVQPLVSDQLGLTFVYSGALVLLYMLVSRVIQSQALGGLLTFKPTILVVDGVIDASAMKRVKITVPHLMAELRTGGYPALDDVRYVLLEETGKISVIPRSDKRPLQPADISLRPDDEGLPLSVIAGGEIMGRNLAVAGLSREWLDTQLEELGISPGGIKKITLATYYTGSGRLRIDYGKIARSGTGKSRSSGTRRVDKAE